MSLILNEREWAERTIAQHDLGKHPIETLDRIARYYRQVDGCRTSDTRRRLEHFLLRCDPYANLVAWSATLDRILKKSAKRRLIEIDSIPITEHELEVVASVGSMSLQRLAFTLLCMAKYWNVARSENNNWVNTPDKEVLATANVNTSIKRQCGMFHSLCDCGFIQFGKKVDNLNVRVLVEPDGEEVLHITDFKNLGNQYMMHRGEPYFPCEDCGAVIRKRSPRQKYCPACANENYLRKSAESVRRQRQKRAQAAETSNLALV